MDPGGAFNHSQPSGLGSTTHYIEVAYNHRIPQNLNSTQQLPKDLLATTIVNLIHDRSCGSYGGTLIHKTNYFCRANLKATRQKPITSRYLQPPKPLLLRDTAYSTISDDGEMEFQESAFVKPENATDLKIKSISRRLRALNKQLLEDTKSVNGRDQALDNQDHSTIAHAHIKAIPFAKSPDQSRQAGTNLCIMNIIIDNNRKYDR